MIRSMTGYGKAEAGLKNGKLTIEIRTLNGKTADINLKSQLLPRDRELEVRARIASRLVRGTIDVYLGWEADSSESARRINAGLARAYMKDVGPLAAEMGLGPGITSESVIAQAILLGSVLRVPDLLEAKKAEVIGEDEWESVEAALDACLDMVDEYRRREGEALYADVTSRVSRILALYDGVESHEKERTDAVRQRILDAAGELGVKLDPERFEQEMIFYLEKYDINEEKVRLRQHCKYFMDTIDSEPNPGKKLGFIIQEMGREINTTGSKANHSEIQKLVVQMKDELEKIREQSMNIL